VITIFSRGIAKIPHLEQFLDEPIKFEFWKIRGDAKKIAGWGLKPSAKKARQYAEQWGALYISLEDGFLRSVGLGGDGAQLHSLIYDYTGIYYDSTRPSDLEKLIIDSDFNDEELNRARRCMALMRFYRLSKYNHAKDSHLKFDQDRQYVLVVDQTYGDASVEYGGADEKSFIKMLNTAISDNPGIDILVKIHPDVIAGKKRGYLLETARELGCVLVIDDVSPWSLLDLVDHVYVVTSQMGFEALLAGKKVSCFGLPFYAGWGLTKDFLQCDRRGLRRSLDQVFAAAYLEYCRYINPYTGVRCELEDTIALMSDQKRTLERFRGQWVAIGFSRWKKSFIPFFLGLFAKVKTINYLPVGIENVSSDIKVLRWASALEPELIERCNQAGIELWRMEDGFVRSVGLGSDLVEPLSLVLDSRGIYYDSFVPSDLEVILNEVRFDDEILLRATKVREHLIRFNLSKYNVGTSAFIDLPDNRRIILVVGQVETDASIAKGSPQIKSNLALLRQVHSANSDAYILYKPHPDVLAGGRYGEIDISVMEGLCDVVISSISITELFNQVDEIHTMSSLTGFEALLRGIKVVTYGLPFYAGWGLTQDFVVCNRRTRKLSLDELVAGTLILYPVYVDPVTREHINVETAIELLARQRELTSGSNFRTSVYRIFRNYFLKC